MNLPNEMKRLSRENEINAPMFSRLTHQLQIPQSSSPFPISFIFFFHLSSILCYFFLLNFFHQQCLQLHLPNADSDLPPHPSRPPPLLLPPANPPAVASLQLPIHPSHPPLFVKSSPMKIKSNRSNLHPLNPNGTPKVKSVSQLTNYLCFYLFIYLLILVALIVILREI